MRVVVAKDRRGIEALHATQMADGTLLPVRSQDHPPGLLLVEPLQCRASGIPTP